MIVDEGSTDLDALKEELKFELIVLHGEVMKLEKSWDFSAGALHPVVGMHTGYG
jgi:hypothetical protein